MYASRTRAAYAAVFATATSLSLIAAIVPAHAALMETKSLQVSYGDLNLASPEGVSRLNTRIKAAADRICRVRDNRELRLLQNSKDCRDQALDKAQHDIRVAIANQSAAPQLANLKQNQVIGIGQ